MRLLVLAGGFGTRLKTTIADVPKALAPIDDVPFLQLQIEHWLSQGLREFTFLLHHQADQIIAFLQAQQGGLLKDCQVDWLIEPVPMDTGGALAHAVKTLELKDDFLMTSAGNLLGGGIYEMEQSSAPAMAVINLADVSRYGQVHFDHLHRVNAFSEKWLMSCGLDQRWSQPLECRPFRTLLRPIFLAGARLVRPAGTKQAPECSATAH